MSQRLGQSELFEPAPTSKLLVAEGAVSWWGVDPSTLRVAIATIDPERRRGSSIIAFDTTRSVIERLPEIRSETRRLALELVASVRPGVVVMEKPAGFGDRPNPELAYGAGAVLCGLVEAVSSLGTKVKLIEGSKWKRVSCGRGDIKKPKPKSGEAYAVLAWARTLGYVGSSWDEADAYGIAEYARRTFLLEQR